LTAIIATGLASNFAELILEKTSIPLGTNVAKQKERDRATQ
jgi:hypothetical protein